VFREERFQRILQAVQESGHVTAADLSRDLGVSEITIRRDLRELADRGLLHRAYGGATVPHYLTEEHPLMLRMLQDKGLKEAIGRETAELVRDGESVFIGSGSTTAYVARFLTHRSRLTVITNALNIGMEMACAPGITTVLLGGMLRASELSLIGHIAEQAIREVRVDKVIIGISALNVQKGLTNDFLPEVMTDRAIIDMAPEIIVVADHKKLGKVASAYVAPLSKVKLLVTDSESDEKEIFCIRQAGIQVILAQG
jgi:DeoR/GlpR family transcriptional regulator of sugar metabolism